MPRCLNFCIGRKKPEMASVKIPDVIPTPTQDAETLYKAFKGLGTNEKAIITVLGHRNASQRKMIREKYQQLYQNTLVDDLFSELSGDFRKAVILWTYDPPERDARLANEALKSKKKSIIELQVIIEIACASSPHHLISVRQAYCSLFDCSLEEDIISYVSQPVQKILVALVSSYRFDKAVVDPNVATLEAATLHESIKAKQLDRNGVLWILSTRNFFQLRATFQCYKEKYGNPIDQDVEKCGKGLLEAVLKVIIWCIDCPEKHFAEVVRYSIEGFGTDEDTLSRAIVTRAEIDMLRVREEYLKLTKRSLDSDVIGDTSGYYKDFLLTLLEAKQ